MRGLDKKYQQLFEEHSPYIEQYPREQQCALVTECPTLIKCFKIPDFKLQLKAVRSEGESIKHIHNPCEQVKIAAVKRDGMCIRFIETQSSAVRLAALKSNLRALEYMQNQTQEEKLFATSGTNGQNQNGFMRYIQDPDEEIVKRCIMKYPEIIRTWSVFKNFPPLSMVFLIHTIQTYPTCIRFIDDPVEELQLIAIEKDNTTYSLISNPTEKATLTFEMTKHIN